MKLIIDIPNEFVEHFKQDKFYDSLMRLKTDSYCLAGKYEQELVDMLICSFHSAKEMPKKRNEHWLCNESWDLENIVNAENRGWNDCIDEIVGGDE